MVSNALWPVEHMSISRLLSVAARNLDFSLVLCQVKVLLGDLHGQQTSFQPSRHLVSLIDRVVSDVCC